MVTPLPGNFEKKNVGCEGLQLCCGKTLECKRYVRCQYKKSLAILIAVLRVLFVIGKSYHPVAQRYGPLFKEKPESIQAAIPLC